MPAQASASVARALPPRRALPREIHAFAGISPKGPLPYRMIGNVNSAPWAIPVGQRLVTVFSLVKKRTPSMP